VLTHFEILKTAVAAEGGCIVKTMGDAVMAVFPRPLAALRAMVRAQRWLARPRDFAMPAHLTVPASSVRPLALKAGLHHGSCLAINLNDRLDYFGSTVNLAARLCAQCSGTDLVLSAALRLDPEIAAYLEAPESDLATMPELVVLRGFGPTPVELCRVSPK
jgi:class 3 adenylate cyclase